MYSILDAISYVGGLANVLKFVILRLAFYLQLAQVKFQMIKNIYFLSTPNFLGKHFKAISYPYRFAFQKWNTLKIQRFTRMKKKLQVKIEKRLFDDFNMVNVVDTLYKIKALLKVLVAGNQTTVLRAKQLYF